MNKNQTNTLCRTGFATPSVTFYEHIKNVTEQVANLLRQKTFTPQENAKLRLAHSCYAGF